MFLYQSNKLKTLVRQLSDILSSNPSSPLDTDIIVVQHHGMAQWISLQLAAINGIAAHLEFPLPGRFLGDMLNTFTGTTADLSGFEQPVLLWRIFDALPQLATQDQFKEVHQYIQGNTQAIKCYQLAEAISDIFDKYQVYRPDIISQWDQGNDQSWQAELWRHVSQGVVHKAELFTTFLSQHGKKSFCPPDLPRRCFLFGLNSLPPVYLELLVQMSTCSEIHLFHLSPCQEYWGDLQSEKEQARQNKKRGHTLQEQQDLYITTGNPLLSSWGAVGRDFLQHLLEYDIDVTDKYCKNAEPSILGTVQNQLLTLEDGTDPLYQQLHPFNHDHSLQFHICHSPLREVQVLHNRLLDLFQDNPELTASDILVTAPDIEKYADAIRGVFNSAAPDRRIPFSIADSPLSKEAVTVQAFLDLLALFKGRCTAPEVMALLETDPLLARFALQRTDLPKIRQWVDEVRIRWGIDHQHRCSFEGAAFDENSWQFGLQKLLLGYFMVGDDAHFQGLYPYPTMSESYAELLGGFASFISQLQNWLPRLHRAGNAEQWSQLLLELLHTFFDQERDPVGFTIVSEAILQFSQDTHNAALDSLLDPDIVMLHFSRQLQQPASGRVFLTGRVTFCNMVPMRAVPFPVICLLGMNDAAFPRVQQTFSFDLTVTEPRPGDRDRRKDDRYLFLEILLSAENTLYISWTGRDQRDNAESPPSAVVCELLDYLDSSFPQEPTPPSQQVTTVHPLQPFSPKSFAQVKNLLSSYAPEWLPSVRKKPAGPFVKELKFASDSVKHTVEAQELITFWKHPVRFFLENQLGIRPEGSLVSLEEAEPFSLDALEQFFLRQETVQSLISNQQIDAIEHRLHTSGILPQAGFGITLMDEMRQSSSLLATKIGDLTLEQYTPIEIDASIGPWQLKGWLHNLYGTGRVTWRSAHVKSATLLEMWINHLLLNLAAPPGVPPRSVHCSKEQTMVFMPVADPQQHLHQLLTLFFAGATRPLHFFPESSLAAAKAKPGKQTKDALQKWQGNYWVRGEREHPAYQLVFGTESIDPLDHEFIQLSELFMPLLEHIEPDDAAT